MKYCKTCKQLCFGDNLPFDGCKHKLREIEDINEPVRLCIAGGTERAMLTGMLKDANIPYVEENVYPQGVANEIVTGYDVKLSNISIVVPFSALPKASELLGTIETLNNDLEPHMDEIKAQIEHLKAPHHHQGDHRAGVFGADRVSGVRHRRAHKLVQELVLSPYKLSLRSQKASLS